MNNSNTIEKELTEILKPYWIQLVKNAKDRGFRPQKQKEQFGNLLSIVTKLITYKQLNRNPYFDNSKKLISSTVIELLNDLFFLSNYIINESKAYSGEKSRLKRSDVNEQRFYEKAREYMIKLKRGNGELYRVSYREVFKLACELFRIDETDIADNLQHYKNGFKYYLKKHPLPLKYRKH